MGVVSLQWHAFIPIFGKVYLDFPSDPNKRRGGVRRTQRLCECCGLCDPQYLIAEAMTLSEMAVLAIDEILLRTEISGRGEEGARRRASEQARRGYGRDKRGPPA